MKSASGPSLPAQEVAGAQGCRREFPLVTSYSCRCFPCCLQVLVLRSNILHCKARGVLVPVLSCEARLDICEGAKPLVLLCSPSSPKGSTSQDR